MTQQDDEEDYTWDRFDTRTVDRKLEDEIIELRAEVGAMAASMALMVEAMHDRGVTTSVLLPPAKPAVLITRRDLEVAARHVLVYHQQVLEADAAIEIMRRGNWVFVHPAAAGVVLDALGVQA